MTTNPASFDLSQGEVSADGPAWEEVVNLAGDCDECFLEVKVNPEVDYERSFLEATSLVRSMLRVDEAPMEMS